MTSKEAIEQTAREQVEMKDDDEVYTSEEAVAKAIQHLAKTAEPKLLTELNEREIRLLTRLITIADKEEFNVPVLRLVADNFMRLRVSTSRKGRHEILDIARAAKEEQDAKSKLKRLLTFGGRI